MSESGYHTPPEYYQYTGHPQNEDSHDEGDRNDFESTNDLIGILNNYLDNITDKSREEYQLDRDNYDAKQSLINTYLVNEAKQYREKKEAALKNQNTEYQKFNQSPQLQNPFKDNWPKTPEKTFTERTDALYKRIQNDARDRWAEPAIVPSQHKEYSNGTRDPQSSFKTKYPGKINQRYDSNFIRPTIIRNTNCPTEFNLMSHYPPKTDRRVSETANLAYYRQDITNHHSYLSKTDNNLNDISNHLNNSNRILPLQFKQSDWAGTKQGDKGKNTTRNPSILKTKNIAESNYFNTSHYRSPEFLTEQHPNFAAMYGRTNGRITGMEIPGLSDPLFDHSEYITEGNNDFHYHNEKSSIHLEKNIVLEDILKPLPKPIPNQNAKTLARPLKSPFQPSIPKPMLEPSLSFFNHNKVRLSHESNESFDDNLLSTNRDHYYPEINFITQEDKPVASNEGFISKLRIYTHLKSGYQAMLKMRLQKSMNVITPSSAIIIHDAGYLVGIVFSLIIIGISGYNVGHDPIISRGYWIYLLFNQIFSVILLLLYLFEIMHYPSIFYTVYALLCLVLTIVGFGLTLVNCFSPDCIAANISSTTRPICQKHQVIVAFMSTNLIFWTVVTTCVIYAYRRGLEVPLEDAGGTEAEVV